MNLVADHGRECRKCGVERPDRTEASEVTPTGLDTDLAATDSTESMEARVSQVMSDRGLTWREAWAAVHRELSDEELAALNEDTPRRSKNPRRNFVWASALTASTIGVILLLLAVTDAADDDSSTTGMVIGLLMMALIPLFAWWVIATIRFLRIPIRPVAWTSSLLGLTLTAIVWNDPCATGPMASLVGLMWIGIGLVAVVTMATLVSSSPQPWERAAGIGVLIIGAAPNLILFAGIALGGLSTC